MVNYIIPILLILHLKLVQRCFALLAFQSFFEMPNFEVLWREHQPVDQELMSMVCTHNHFFDGRRNFMRGYLNDKGLKKMLKRNKLRDKVMSAGFNTFLDDDRQISLGLLTCPKTLWVAFILDMLQELAFNGHLEHVHHLRKF